MIAGNNKIPFVNENLKMQEALKVLRQKNLGIIIARNKRKFTTGVFTDGDLKRKIQKNHNLNKLPLKKVMTKNLKTINQDKLVTKALSVMQQNKITTLCVNGKKSKNITIGIIHIKNILESSNIL